MITETIMEDDTYQITLVMKAMFLTVSWSPRIFVSLCFFPSFFFGMNTLGLYDFTVSAMAFACLFAFA